VVDDVIHLGPPFLHNMMSFERLNGVLKGYVRNRVRPDGSISKGFLSYECILFCQNYLQNKDEDVLGRIHGFGHRDGFVPMHVVFKARQPDFDRAHRVTLQHLELVAIWVLEHKSFIEKKFTDTGRWRTKGDVTREHNSSFMHWFKEKLLQLHHGNMPSTEEEKLLFILSQGPAMNVRTNQAYDINGYTFYTEKKDHSSEHQNSGVTMLRGRRIHRQ
jgi:hypothetical protein